MGIHAVNGDPRTVVTWLLLTSTTLCIYVCVCVKSLQSCLTLCDPMDCSPPCSSVQGILQARMLQWIMPSSRGIFSPPGSNRVTLHLPHWQAVSLPPAPPGKPSAFTLYCINKNISKNSQSYPK